MDGKKYLGIYISRCSATVVSLAQIGKEYKVFDCFTVSVQDKQGGTTDTAELAAQLANLVASQCAQRALPYQDCETGIALDCSLFMQHKIHSEFNDPKQIAQTIRFDTEETTATDISNDALAFEIHTKTQSGTDLNVFTAHRKILNDILFAFQPHNIDPITIEPDVNCLSRFITRYLPSAQNQRSICAILSDKNGYFLIPPSDSEHSSVKRAFLISHAQNRNDLLTAQIALTTALIEDNKQTFSLKAFDAANTLNPQLLTEKLGYQTENIDLTELISAESNALSDCSDKVAFAAAAGAAIYFTDKTYLVNFRADFKPFEGKKQKIQKTLKTIGLSAAICMLALGIYFQRQLIETNKPRKQIRSVFEKDYLAVLPGTKKLPVKFSEAIRKLKKERDRLQKYEKGRTNAEGENTIPAKLTMVLEAFNKCAKRTNLQADSINITGKYIRITGSTSNYQSTMELRKALNESNLNILQDDLFSKGGRHNFSLTIDVK